MIELKAKQLGNTGTELRNTGLAAQNKALELDNRFTEETLGPRIQDTLAQYRGKMSKQDFDELVNTGNIYSQVGQMLYDMPGVATHAKAREILKDRYLPEFDQVPPQALGGVIRYMGQNMSKLQPDFVKKQALESLKIEGKRSIEDEKADRAKELAAYKGALQEKLAQLRINAEKNPSTARGISNKLFEAAQKEQDPERKALLMEQAAGFNDIAFAELERRAAAANANKPDLGKFGIETNPVPPTPSLPGNQPKPQTPQKPSSLADVQKMYPGVPADKLKEAYKRKFGVDLQ